jgi:hypothetical protein
MARSTPGIRPPRPVRALAGSVAIGLVLIGASSPTRASGQDGAVLQGLVAEVGTGRTIASARVTLVGPGTETSSGLDGVFTFPEVPLGRVHVRVRAQGYPTVVEEVEVTPGLLFVPIFLPSAASVLDELLVTGRRSSDARPTPQAQTAADLLAVHVPDLRAGTMLVRPRATPQRLGLRGRGSFGGNGEPTIVLDGALLSGGVEVLRQIPATDVKSIRVLKGPSAAFLYGSSDGVIYIQTEFGPPPPAP